MRNDGWKYDANLTVPNSSMKGGYVKGDFRIMVSKDAEWFFVYYGNKRPIQKSQHDTLEAAKNAAF